MTPLGKSLAASAVLILLIGVVTVSQCGEVGGDQVPMPEDAGVCGGSTQALVKVEEVPPAPPPPPTYQDIYTAIRESLQPHWPEFADHDLYDTARGLMYLSEKVDADPRELAYELTDLAQTIVEMQPLFAMGREGGYTRALAIAFDIYQGASEVSGLSCSDLSSEDFDSTIGVEHGKGVQRVNPYIMASMAYRESRFTRRTEQGYILRNGRKVRNCLYCVGSKGERGMFQFMPNGYIQKRFMPRGCNPFDRMCAVRGAARALAHIRCMCIEEYGDQCTTDVYVAGYGLSRMPPPRRAAHSRGPRMAKAFLCDVRDDCDYLWHGKRDTNSPM